MVEIQSLINRDGQIFAIFELSQSKIKDITNVDDKIKQNMKYWHIASFSFWKQTMYRLLSSLSEKLNSSPFTSLTCLWLSSHILGLT